ncbi:unnamed protein product [Ilex paraguariensis]|uniref:GBF-interacting protein 1 N-terminal domain-containing protein n=1 Tax=Ilex paraguariensis TaxID=185542 RepID=A0ABC8R9E5_9AQUA
MSGRGSNNGGGGGVVGVQSIPAASRKMVQSLKEIVNCPETEIYAMLKECNMDPYDAVNRLLSQDPFHEVKSKRDKKKENKDTPESRSRGASSTSNRGGRSSTDRYVGRGGSNHFSSDASAMHGKPAYKKENGTNSNTSSSFSASGMAGNNMNQQPPALIESITTANKISTISAVDGISSASQPPSGYQPAWLGVPGHVSMADIVKMGRPHGKTSSMSNPSHHSVNHLYGQGTSSTASHPDFHSSEDHASEDSAINPETGVASALHVSSDDEWPLIEEPPAASVPSVLKPPPDSELHPDASNLPFDRTKRRVRFQVNEVHEAAVPIENLSANHVGSASVSSRKILEDNAGGAALYDNDAYKNMGSYHPQSRTFEHQEDGGVSVASVTTNLEQVNIQADQRAPPDEEGPSVIIPNHLQVQTADCSHLSFGSFRSGINDAFSGPFASRPLKTDMDEASSDADADADASSIGHSDTRNSEYYGDESLRIATEGNPIHSPGANARSYDSPSASQPEVLKQENPELLDGNHYAFPSSTPRYTFENAQEMNTAFSQSQTSSQMQNLGPFSSAMVNYM